MEHDNHDMFTKRLFLAYPIDSPTICGQLVNIQDQFIDALPDIDFDWEHQPHITMRFLGSADLTDAGVRDNTRALHDDLTHIIRHADPFPLFLGCLGVFPGVLYCSMFNYAADAERFNKLVGCIDRACTFRRFPASEFPFKAHITVGRFDRALTQQVDAAIERMDQPQPVGFTMDHLELFESFRADGAVAYRRAFQNSKFLMSTVDNP